jgi:hypothetical protein
MFVKVNGKYTGPVEEIPGSNIEINLGGYTYVHSLTENLGAKPNVKNCEKLKYDQPFEGPENTAPHSTARYCDILKTALKVCLEI